MRTAKKYRRIVRNLRGVLLMALLATISTSCSTGIESTKKIKMTKEDVKLMEKSAEQKFAESIHGIPLSQWEKGKAFMATSDRTLYVFEPLSLDMSESGTGMKGNVLTYAGTSSHVNPDLKEECVILFTDGERQFRYRTGKPTAAAMNEIDSSRLPLLSDLDLIDQWKAQTAGREFWTKSNLWYDSNGNRIAGLKFAKVKVEDIVPSANDFPMNIKITDASGREAYLQMNYTSDLHDSRNFAAIFYMSDPRKRYPNISDEHWVLIQHGKVGGGMTKEECKLAIGNPDEVRAGHNRSQTMDIWQYTDGTYLMFTDGLLTNYRQ